MNSVGVGGQTDVDPIINYECCPVECHSAQLARTVQKSLWLFRLRLVAQLDQCHARRDQVFRIADDRHHRIWLRRKGGEVDDGVKRRKEHAASLQAGGFPAEPATNSFWQPEAGR